MKPIKFFLIAALAIGLMACERPSNIVNPTDPTNPASIFGLWQEYDNNIPESDYMRFLTADQEAKDGDYFFGKEWDESEQVYEKDLKYKGNGWFKWKIDGSVLTKIELLDNGGAEIPKTYTIKILNTTQLQLQDPEDKDVDTWTRK